MTVSLGIECIKYLVFKKKSCNNSFQRSKPWITKAYNVFCVNLGLHCSTNKDEASH